MRQLLLFIALILMQLVHATELPTALADIDTVADTVVGKKHWIEELKRGKINPGDTTIHYPRAISWGWNTIRNVNKALNPYDTAYVVGTGKKFKVTIKNNNWFDDYDFKLDDDIKLLFHSRATSNIGASFSAAGISVGYFVSFDRIRGRANASKKLEVSFTCARFALEFYHMTNRGDMTLTFLLNPTFFDLGGERYRYPNFSGLRRKSWAVSGYYIFNNKHYAQSAAYGFSKRQLRSAGSPLAGMIVSHRNFSVSMRDLPQEIRDLVEDEDPDFDKTEVDTAFDYTDTSVSGGYAYNWVLGRRWLFNVTGLIYTGIRYGHKKSSSDAGHYMWGLNGKLKMAISYNCGHFFGGLHGHIDSHIFNTGSWRFNNDMYDFSLIAGFQF